ncbi:MAG: hypothetical protein V4695_08975 [Pseudomonadota bacterium]
MAFAYSTLHYRVGLPAWHRTLGQAGTAPYEIKCFASTAHYLEENAEFVLFSPQHEHTDVMEHMIAKMAS